MVLTLLYKSLESHKGKEGILSGNLIRNKKFIPSGAGV